MNAQASELEAALVSLSDVVRSMTDNDLGQPFRWGAHVEGIRFAQFGIYLEMRGLALELAALRRAEGPPLTRIHQALAQYNAAYLDLQAAMLPVSDELYNREPAPGEWALRFVLGHMVGVERNFYALVDYGWRRQQSPDELSPTLPDGEANRLLGEYAELDEIMAHGSMQAMLAYYEVMRGLALTRFAPISDVELAGPSIWWEGLPFSLEYRLHRFDAHLRQHTIQVDKALMQLNQPPSEAHRLLRLLFSALAEIEASLIGAPDLGLSARQALAERLHTCATEVITALIRAKDMGEAVKSGDRERVDTLLNDDALLVDARGDGDVPLVRTALYLNQPAIAALLVEKGVRLEFHDAAALGRIEELETMLQEMGDWILDDYSRDGYTALQLACFFGRTEAALLLLQKGAKVGLVSHNGMRIQAIHAATAANDVDSVAALLQHGADPNAEQQGAFRPLHAAAQNGNIKLVELLIDKGADVSLTSDQGQTAHDLAIASGHAEVAEILAL